MTKVQKQLVKSDSPRENVKPLSLDEVVDIFKKSQGGIQKYILALDTLENSNLVVPPLKLDELITSVWTHAFESFQE